MKIKSRHSLKTSFRLHRIYAIGLVVLLTTFPFSSIALSQPDRYALLIGGLGGTEEYTSRFRTYLLDTRRVLVETAGFQPDHVTVLAESGPAEGIDGVSDAETIQRSFQNLTRRLQKEDMLVIIFFGHGSYDGKNAQINIPRRDLNDVDYAALLDGLPAERIIVINTASASGPFAQVLSAPGRIVITATRTGTQRNETLFPRFLVEALGPPGDLDKDHQLTVTETFAYISQKVTESFEAENHVPTEQAMLEDTGDGKAMRLEELEAASEGNLASVTYLYRSSTSTIAGNTRAPAALVSERDRLERAIAGLKATKTNLEVDAYYAQLETLFVELARLNDRMEKGGP